MDANEFKEFCASTESLRFFRNVLMIANERPTQTPLVSVFAANDVRGGDVDLLLAGLPLELDQAAATFP